MSAPVLSADESSLSRAADVLRRGGLVALPTETVYGLACDAANGEAIARLYAAKGRPSFNPLIAHVSPGAMAEREVHWSDRAERLAGEFWPGPLTLVLPFRRETGSVAELARAGLDTLALRAPDHDVAARLIASFGAPLVAPSANPSGRMSPTRAEHVAADMGAALDLILDGGPCRVGLESTIVSLCAEAPALLRPGGLDPRAIEDVLGEKLTRTGGDPDAPSSPGQLLRHYAPSAALRLDAEQAQPGEALLQFGAAGGDGNLSEAGSLTEAAARLFSELRRLDASFDRIAVARVPNVGLGLAINDRLIRASRRG